MNGQHSVICARFPVPCSDPQHAESVVTTLKKVIGWSAGAGAVNYINEETTTVIELTDTMALIQVGFTYPIPTARLDYFNGLLRNLMADMQETVSFFKPDDAVPSA